MTSAALVRTAQWPVVALLGPDAGPCSRFLRSRHEGVATAPGRVRSRVAQEEGNVSKDHIDDRLSSIPMFADCSKKELRSISRLMTQLSIPAGKELIRQGEPGREFMIILDGSAEVSRDGEVIAELGSGDFLGEIAVLSGAPRNATVIATSELAIEALNRREFMTLLDENPKLAKKILLGAVQRLSEHAPSHTA